MKKKILQIFSIAVFTFLTGCQSIYQIEPPTQLSVGIDRSDPQWQQHLQDLTKIRHYTTKGQFGYITPSERFSANFTWQYQIPTDFRLTLSSNLSSKSLKLQRHSSGITISDSEGRSRTEANVDQLMHEILGITFPIDQLAYWLKGQPENHSQYIVNEKRQLAQFDYMVNGSNWRVNFVEYHENRLPNLPKLIVLENGKQTLKIRIDEWVY